MDRATAAKRRVALVALAKAASSLSRSVLIAILLLGLGSYFFVSRGVVATHQSPFRWRSFLRTRWPMFSNGSSNSDRPLRLRCPPPRRAATNETPTPAPGPATPERQLVVTAGEINGLIAANKKSRGHAYVTLSGNTATVQISIPTDKVPGLPRGYLNGSFNITTDGPTPLTALKVSKIEANGYSVPSGVLSMSYRGRSFMGYALEAVAPYKVSTVEVQDGRVIAR